MFVSIATVFSVCKHSNRGSDCYSMRRVLRCALSGHDKIFVGKFSVAKTFF